MFTFVPSHRLREDALEQAKLASLGMDYFQVFVAPASGPRWLATVGFETAFLAQALDDPQRRTPQRRYFFAGSAGSLRFTALLMQRATGHAYVDKLVNEYIRLDVNHRASLEQRTAALRRLVSLVYLENPQHVEAMLHDQENVLCIFVCRLKPFLADRPVLLQHTAVAFAAVLSLLSPSALGLVIDRLCFTSQPVSPDLFTGRTSRPHVQYLPLTSGNLADVLYASCSIPGVVTHLQHIDGAGAGVFIDGGLADYCLNLEFRAPALLVNHGKDVKQVWTHKLVPLRVAPTRLMQHCSYVYPNDEFTSRMETKSVPNRNDFRAYADRDDERRQHWRHAVDTSLAHWPNTLFVDALFS